MYTKVPQLLIMLRKQKTTTPLTSLYLLGRVVVLTAETALQLSPIPRSRKRTATNLETEAFLSDQPRGIQRPLWPSTFAVVHSAGGFDAPELRSVQFQLGERHMRLFCAVIAFASAVTNMFKDGACESLWRRGVSSRCMDQHRVAAYSNVANSPSYTDLGVTPTTEAYATGSRKPYSVDNTCWPR